MTCICLLSWFCQLDSLFKWVAKKLSTQMRSKLWDFYFKFQNSIYLKGLLMGSEILSLIEPIENVLIHLQMTCLCLPSGLCQLDSLLKICHEVIHLNLVKVLWTRYSLQHFSWQKTQFFLQSIKPHTPKSGSKGQSFSRSLRHNSPDFKHDEWDYHQLHPFQLTPTQIQKL